MYARRSRKASARPDVYGRTMMKWLMATLAGKKPDIDRVGLSYMLMGEARQGQGATPAKDPSEVKKWFYVGPHVMVVLPDSAKDALRGINQDLSNDLPYTSLLSSADVATPLWVIPVAKGGDMIKEGPRQTAFLFSCGPNVCCWHWNRSGSAGSGCLLTALKSM